MLHDFGYASDISKALVSFWYTKHNKGTHVLIAHGSYGIQIN